MFDIQQDLSLQFDATRAAQLAEITRVSTRWYKPIRGILE
jgi:hypothetical protein